MRLTGSLLDLRELSNNLRNLCLYLDLKRNESFGAARCFERIEYNLL